MTAWMGCCCLAMLGIHVSLSVSSHPGMPRVCPIAIQVSCAARKEGPEEDDPRLCGFEIGDRVRLKGRLLSELCMH